MQSDNFKENQYIYVVFSRKFAAENKLLVIVRYSKSLISLM